jgi:predicted SprT family Zn-dependent metalloprotease
LESHTRELLCSIGAEKLAREIRVEWNPRLKTCAGRADYREKLISLNPLLLRLDSSQIDPTKLECNMHSSVTSWKQMRRVARKLECNMHSSLMSDAGEIDEVERTLRHELAHLLAQWRVGRRRIAPHGAEWRRACRDLGIADEARCHNLPFASKVLPPRFVYVCPNCKDEFPRVRRIRRAIACVACCRKHNGGDFDPRFRLRLLS